MVLANLPADAADRRRAAFVVAALMLAFLAAAPYAKVALPPFPGFVLIYQAALVIVDLITAVFLFGLLRVTGSRGILVLAAGYVFTACMAIAHGLSFPGAFTPAGLLDGGESTPWLFALWHGAFPLVVIAYVLLRRREHLRADGRDNADAPRWSRTGPLVASAVAVALACACTLFVVRANDGFPLWVLRFDAVVPGTVFGWALLGVTLVALVTLAFRKPRSLLDVWLLVVLCAWAINVALVALLNAGRYDVGFYLGRTYGLLASGLMMIVLLAEQSKLYAGLVDAQREMKAAAALRENRDVLALAMRAGQMGVWSRDLTEERVWWSSELEAIFGLAPGSFAGTEPDFLDFVVEEDRPLITAAVGEAIASHGDYSVEFRFHTAADELRWMEGRGRAVYDESGAPVMLYGLGIDITARKEAQAALIESEARFRTLADNIAQLAWMAAPSGEVVWYNKRFFDYTGVTLEQVAGRGGWRTIHHPDHVDRVAATIRHCFATGETWEDTFPLRGRDGAYRWFLSRAIPIRDETGKVQRWFGTSTDVTAEREAADALREMDRRKDEFLAVLAHELRNPLAPLSNALEILDRFEPGSAQSKWARELMGRQIAHMTRLVDDLMDVSRVTRGAVELRRERIDAGAIVERAIETSRPLIDRGGQTLVVDLSTDALPLDGDPARLTQAVANLLNNAARYTPAGGRIEIGARREGDDAVIRVRDDGVGIERDLLQRMFDMFAQGPQSRGQGGLGIGLTLARTLVRMHGGRVEAASEGPGRGSTFTVRLPLARAPTAIAAATSSTDAPVVTIPRRVLVVDDNVDAALSLGMLLTQMGHDVEVAHDGDAALGRAFAFRPDVVFLDLALPGKSGYEVARTLRSSTTVNDVRIVALTGYSQQDDRRKSAEAGFDAHLVKPVDVAAIGRALE